MPECHNESDPVNQPVDQPDIVLRGDHGLITQIVKSAPRHEVKTYVIWDLQELQGECLREVIAEAATEMTAEQRAFEAMAEHSDADVDYPFAIVLKNSAG